MVEIDVVNRALKGDNGALTQIYNETIQKAHYICLSYVRDEDVAQDILQDAYIQAFSSLETLENANSLEPWIDRIVRNKSLDYLKKKKMLNFSDLGDDGQEGILEIEDENEAFVPEKLVDTRETRRLVREMIDWLPDDQRTCIFMRFYEDMSVKEIAGVLGVNEETVKSRIRYAKKKLKEEVLELEKKGTKLYVGGIVPLLIWFFKAESAKACALADMSCGIISAVNAGGGAGGASGVAAAGLDVVGSGGTVGAEISGMAGATGGVAAAGTVAGGLGIKIVAGVAAVAVIGAGIFGVTQVINGRGDDEIVAEQSAEVEAEEPEIEEEGAAAEVDEPEEMPEEEVDPNAPLTDEEKQEMLDAYSDYFSQSKIEIPRALAERFDGNVPDEADSSDFSFEVLWITEKQIPIVHASCYIEPDNEGYNSFQSGDMYYLFRDGKVDYVSEINSAIVNGSENYFDGHSLFDSGVVISNPGYGIYSISDIGQNDTLYDYFYELDPVTMRFVLLSEGIWENAYYDPENAKLAGYYVNQNGDMEISEDEKASKEDYDKLLKEKLGEERFSQSYIMTDFGDHKYLNTEKRRKKEFKIIKKD